MKSHGLHLCWWPWCILKSSTYLASKFDWSMNSESALLSLWRLLLCISNHLYAIKSYKVNTAMEIVLSVQAFLVEWINSSQVNLWIQRHTLDIIKASSWDYGTYHTGNQQRLRRACTSAQSRQSLRCVHTWSMEVDEGSDQKSDI